MSTRATVVSVFLALLMAGCTSGDGNGDEAKPQAAPSSAGGQLFVASASEGTLKPLEADHEFTLTLGRAHDSVSVFTDRPQRKAGTESLADFAAAWDERGFTKTPPNAAVVWGKDSSTRIFELSDPAYDEAADTLAFTAHDLGDESSTALSSAKGIPDDEVPTDLGEVAVFIDNAEGKSGGALYFFAPPGGEATLAFDGQTVASSAFRGVKGKGEGKQSSPTELEFVCNGTEECWFTASFTLNPGTWPIEGTLEVSSGTSVEYQGAAAGSATVEVPPGDFNFVELLGGSWCGRENCS